jgi:hypothetical protein
VTVTTDVILEICNSLIIIFLITEIHRISKSSSHFISGSFTLTLRSILSLYSSILLIFVLWALFIFLYYYFPIQSILSSFSFLSITSSSSLFLIVILFLFVGIFLFFTFRLHNQSSLLSSFNSFLQQRFITPLLSLLFLFLFFGFFFLYSGGNLYVQWLSQFSLILISFVTVLYLDVHRFRNDITIRKFLLGLFQAVLYSLGAIPILMILISFFFLILSSLLEALGTHPENSSSFNQLIYYGTLYGPFYVIYWNAKHRLLRSPYLP